MTCPSCGGECTRYDEYRVACRKCHTIWTLPEHADKVRERSTLAAAGKPMVRLQRAPRFPAWLPGAVLGGLALLGEVVSWLL
jgi:hypothetical protein